LRTRGVTVFVTTHHLDEAENCTEVLFMQRGRDVGHGSPRALRDAAHRGDLARVEGVSADRLRASERVRDLTPMGAAWHVRLCAPGDAEPLAAELGVPVRVIRPSL